MAWASIRSKSSRRLGISFMEGGDGCRRERDQIAAADQDHAVYPIQHLVNGLQIGDRWKKDGHGAARATESK